MPQEVSVRAPFRFSLLLVLAAAVLVPAAGCAAFKGPASPSEEAAPLLVGIGDVEFSEARALIEKGVPVLDVREPHEFDAGRIPGARNLPLGELGAWSAELDPAGAYVLVCRSGRRSRKAMEALEAMGFKNLRNVKGGMLSWEREGQAVEK